MDQQIQCVQLCIPLKTVHLCCLKLNLGPFSRHYILVGNILFLILTSFYFTHQFFLSVLKDTETNRIIILF